MDRIAPRIRWRVWIEWRRVACRLWGHQEEAWDAGRNQHRFQCTRCGVVLREVDWEAQHLLQLADLRQHYDRHGVCHRPCNA